MVSFLKLSAQLPRHNSLFPFDGRDFSCELLFRLFIRSPEGFATAVTLLFLKIILELKFISISQKKSQKNSEIVLAANSSQCIQNLFYDTSHWKIYSELIFLFHKIQQQKKPLNPEQQLTNDTR